MSVIAINRTSAEIATRGRASEDTTRRYEVDVTAVAVVLAVLAIVGMFTVFAALAGSMAVTAGCGAVTTVLSVSAAFHQLRRAGL